MRLEADLPMGPREAKAIASTLAGDRDSKRSHTKVLAGKSSLRVEIDADDAVAMRAAINSQLRLIDSCLKCLGVTKHA